MSTILEISKVPGLKRLYYLSVATATVCGLFCAIFVAILLYNYHVVSHPAVKPMAFSLQVHQLDENRPLSSDPSYRQPASDAFNLLPTDHKKFLELKTRLAADKQNESLREEIRQLDQKLRVDFFKRRETITRISPFLLLAAIVFLTSARTAGVLRRQIPVPSGEATEKARQQENRRVQFGSVAVVAVSMAMIGIAVGLLLMPSSPFEQVLEAKFQEEADHHETARIETTAPGASGEKPTTISVAPDPVQDEAPLDRDAFLVELAENWPSFRGFDCSGTGRAENPPVQWDAVKGENILWQTEVPLPGKSSPVVWKNRVFLSGADEKKRQVFCFDTENGKLLWTADAPSTPESSAPYEASEDTGRAAPTMVVDGRRTFALFGNGDLVAVDFEGNVLWSKSLGIPISAYGFSASPALYFDRLIVQYDVSDGTDGKSKLFAFDVKTGETVWETPREIPNSWSSPMVKKIEERFQIITCGDPFVIAYDPENGSEIWRCKCLSGDVGPSPAAFGNVVYITNQGPRTTAIDATGTGDVTETNVLWRGTNALPDTPSPFAAEDRVYTFDSYGYMTAYDPKNINEKNNRAMYWELEIGGGMAKFYSSPLLVGNLVYAFDMSEEDPKAFVVDLSKAKTDDSGALDEDAAQAMIVATNPMSEPCVASPAVSGGRIYIRGEKSIFCIGPSP